MEMHEEMDYSEHDNDDELEDELASDLESDEDYGTLYNCNICKATNMALQDFLSHSKVHTKEEKQMALYKIVNSKMVKEEAAKSAAAAFGFRVQESLGSSVTLYQCIVCGQGNLMLKQVREHSAIHSQYLESNFCSICQRQFPSHKSLNSHFAVHLDNNDLICQYCNKKFDMLDELEAHEDQHYSAEYLCVDCRVSFRSKELVLVHLKDRHLKDTTCLICDVEFKSSHVINKHLISHAIVRAIRRTASFICDLCGKKYDSKVALQRHRLFFHNNRLPFICEHCGFFAYHETPIKAHIEKAHGENEDRCVCFKCGPLTNDKNQMSSQEGEVAFLVNVCRFCGLEFKNRACLTSHLKTHGELKSTGSFPKSDTLLQISKKESPVACSLCREIFMPNDFCLTHSLCHVDRVLCNLCGKPFKSETALNCHLNDTHVSKFLKLGVDNVIFPFKCKSCSLYFKLEFELDEHRETHKYIQYQCHLCFKEFSTDNSLQDHLDTHDEEIN